MCVPRSSICLSPVVASEPRILLGGARQTSLIKHLDGLTRARGKACDVAVQFVERTEALAGFPSDRFDLAVVQTPVQGDAARVIAQLTRIARQGLITLR